MLACQHLRPAVVGLFAVLVIACLPAWVQAQTPPQSSGQVFRLPSGGSVKGPSAGDCSLTITLAPQVELNDLKVFIGGQELQKLPTRAPYDNTIELLLNPPLDARDQLRVGVGDGPQTEIPISPSVHTTACDRIALIPKREKPVWDGRELFEPTAFYGLAVDNFAPASLLNYSSASTDPVRTRRVVGLIADYRAMQWHDGQQLWITAIAVNGVRSADVDCNESSHRTLCGGFDPTDVQERFLRTIEHASTLEAHFDPRFEFATLNPEGSTPVRVFVGAQIGLYGLDGADKLFGSSDIGFGATASRGPFRHSSVMWAFGYTGLFRSDPGWNRFKVRARIVVDTLAGLRERAPWVRYLGVGAWRGFLAVNVDRSWHLRGADIGPDSFQTYVGVAFDLAKALVP